MQLEKIGSKYIREQNEKKIHMQIWVANIADNRSDVVFFFFFFTNFNAFRCHQLFWRAQQYLLRVMVATLWVDECQLSQIRTIFQGRHSLARSRYCRSLPSGAVASKAVGWGNSLEANGKGCLLQQLMIASEEQCAVEEPGHKHCSRCLLQRVATEWQAAR